MEVFVLLKFDRKKGKRLSNEVKVKERLKYLAEREKLLFKLHKIVNLEKEDIFEQISLELRFKIQAIFVFISTREVDWGKKPQVVSLFEDEMREELMKLCQRKISRDLAIQNIVDIFSKNLKILAGEIPDREIILNWFETEVRKDLLGFLPKWRRKISEHFFY